MTFYYYCWDYERAFNLLSQHMTHSMGIYFYIIFIVVK